MRHKIGFRLSVHQEGGFWGDADVYTECDERTYADPAIAAVLAVTASEWDTKILSSTGHLSPDRSWWINPPLMEEKETANG